MLRRKETQIDSPSVLTEPEAVEARCTEQVKDLVHGFPPPDSADEVPFNFAAKNDCDRERERCCRSISR